MSQWKEHSFFDIVFEYWYSFPLASSLTTCRDVVTTYFVNSKLSSASRLFCTEPRKMQFSILTRKPTAWNLKIALQRWSGENKEKLEVSFSHARTTREEQKQLAPSSHPSRFTQLRRAIASVGISVCNLSTLVRCRKNAYFDGFYFFLPPSTPCNNLQKFCFDHR